MKFLINAVLLLCSLGVAAQTCLPDSPETTATDSLTDLSGGEVWHVATGLVWQRCALGQIWNGATCLGEAEKYTWQEALELAQQASHDDLKGWRLPNIKELASITERACVRPSINAEWFPQTPEDDFWSSTPSATDPERAWVVAFFNASHSLKQKDRYVYVRLVRTYTEE
ncbi:DUF1566 domain-containing protein [Alteromonas aestuariivivens]|uniref:DUF1566 domain-containing protein n=1 Tax=Alteromonas aestuariivivens TaxID=1938339 RepID=A0A3D8M3S0_9ALTE|nr:DUF1566 domain-containing protein [Alteromonas aestuariivivens]RDV24339.1 DUF1566 domain-containing protein [Alteromonas aestuariivivens]